MENLVQITDGKVTTTSLKIAEVFEKQHQHVLRAIRELQIPESFRQSNFGETVIARPNPSGGKDIPSNAYIITRDGFTLLAMGFTGAKAMEFKLKYIEAFNRMEEELKNRSAACDPVLQQLAQRIIKEAQNQVHYDIGAFEAAIKTCLFKRGFSIDSEMWKAATPNMENLKKVLLAYRVKENIKAIAAPAERGRLQSIILEVKQ